MSTTIDQKVVEMQFNNSNFEKNVSTSMSTLEKLKSSLNFDSSSDSFSKLGTAAESISVKFSALEVAAVTALSNIVNKAVDAGVQLVESLSVDNIAAGWEKYAEKTQSVGTLISQGYDLDTVNEQLERLNWYTDETSYNFTDMVSNIAKFTASGQDLETSVTAMEGIANWAALSGQNATTASQAMYQLAQAMSAGYMRLEDYKSVQNASMDTAEFRQKCLDAAVALGTLQDNADGTYTTIVDGASSIDFTLSSFTTSLTEGAWLTSDVMMEVFNEYSSAVDDIYEYAEEKGITASEAIEELGDSVDEFGLKAFKAAQEARTWADVIDSVKDAVSTGWMNTFEIIFGDYEEAKTLWTDLANAMYDVFAGGAYDRNEMLTEAFSKTDISDYISGLTGLKTEAVEQLQEMGSEAGYTSEEFAKLADSLLRSANNETIEAMREEAEAAGMSAEVFDNLAEVMYAYDENSASVVAHLLELQNSTEDVTTYVCELTGASEDTITELRELGRKTGYTSDEFLELAESVTKGDKALQAVVTSLLEANQVSGRELALEAFWNAWEGIGNLLGQIKEAFRDIFPATTAEQLYKFLDKINEASEKLKEFFALSDEGEPLNKTFANIKSTFKGLFAALDIVKQALLAVWDALEPVRSAIGLLAGGILNVTGNIGDWVVGLDDAIKTSGTFTKIAEKVSGVLETIGTIISDTVNPVVVSFIEGGEGFSGVLEVIFDKIVDVIRIITKLIEAFTGLDISDYTDPIVTFIQQLRNKVVDFVYNFDLSDIIDSVKSFTDSIGEKFPAATQAVKDFIESAKEKFSTPGFDLFHTVLSGIGTVIETIIGLIGAFKEKIGEAFSTIGETLDRSSVWNMLDSLWTVIVKIATAIAGTLGTAVSALIEALGNADFESFFNILNSFVTTGLIASVVELIHNFASGLGDVADFLKDMKDGAVDVLDGIGDALEAWSNNLKSDTILNIAIAVGILAVSLIALTGVDADSLQTAIAAIVELTGDLVIAFTALEKLTGANSTGIKDGITNFIDSLSSSQQATGLIKMAGAIAILAIALKLISTIDTDQLGSSFAAITGLITDLTVAMIALNKLGGSVSGTTTMIGLSVAILLLSSAVKSLGDLSWEEIGKGLTSVTALCIDLVASMIALNKLGGSTKGALAMIELAIAIKILASACEDFGEMSWEEIGKGLTSVGVLLGELAAFAVLTKNSSNLISTGIGLIEIAAAMKIFASAMGDFSAFSWEEIAKGLVAMGGALAEVAIAVNLMPKNTISIGAGLVILGAALEIIADVMGKMGEMSWEEIAKGLVAMGVALAEFAIALNAMESTLAGAAALLVAALAVDALTPALKALGEMSWEEIVKGLVALAGAFTVIGAAAAILSPLTTTILALGAAVALLGVGLASAGVGVVAISAGLTSLSVSLTAVVTSIKTIILAVVSLIPDILIAIGEGIVGICQVIAEGAPTIGVAVVAVVLAVVDVLTGCVPELVSGVLEIILGILDALVEYVPPIVTKLVALLIGLIEALGDSIPELLIAVMDFIGKLFNGIIEAINGLDTASLVEGIAVVGLLSAMVVALSAISSLIPGAMAALAELAVLVAEMGVIIAAFGAIAQIPGVEWLISEGGNLLEAIGTAIGQFVGGVVGGVMSGVTSQFPQIGQDLSDFMTNAQTFISGASAIDSSMVKGVEALAEVILLLTAADILNGLTSWFTGGSSLADFGEQLEPFGESMHKFADALVGIDPDLVYNAALAGKALAEMASTLPNSGGVLGFFMGENDMDTFGKQLESFGKSMLKFSIATVGLRTDVIDNAVTAGKAVAELAKELPNSGGVLGFLMGENDMDTFGEQLVSFGAAMLSFSLASFGIKTEVVDNAVTAGKAVASLAKELPNDGGVIDFFTGSNDMETFGNQLKSFGAGLKTYSLRVKGIDSAVVENSITAASALAELAANLPTSGGIFSWFTGEQDMSKFGDQLADFGEGLADYYEEVKDINSTKLKSAVSAVQSLVDMAIDLDTIDSKTLTNFAKDLKSVGKTGVDDFIDAFNDSNTKVKTAVETFVKKAISAAEDKGKDLVNSFATIVKNIMKEFTDKYTEFQTLGKNVVSKFITGVENKASTAVSKFATIMSDCIKEIKSNYDDFKDAGEYLVKGFAKGIDSYSWYAEDAARAMAKAAVDAVNDELDINSPSKVGAESGGYFGMGFVNELIEYAEKSYDAGAQVASAAKNGLSDAIAKIGELVDSDIDTEPTIRPVLDLTEVQNKANMISSMFDDSQSIKLSSSIDGENITRIQNGRYASSDSDSTASNNDDVVAAIAALRSDFSDMEEVISNLKIVMDSGTLVGSIAKKMDTALGRQAAYEGRGI